MVHIVESQLPYLCYIYILKFMSKRFHPSPCAIFYVLIRLLFSLYLVACLLQTGELQQAGMVGQEIWLGLVKDTNSTLENLTAARLKLLLWR